ARPLATAEGLIGMGWLYALHARSSIERGRAWQAEDMISGLRDQVLAPACLRPGVPAVGGRRLDRLPPVAPAKVACGQGPPGGRGRASAGLRGRYRGANRRDPTNRRCLGGPSDGPLVGASSRMTAAGRAAEPHLSPER